jgi:oligopeptide transport system substrate-binding protein
MPVRRLILAVLLTSLAACGGPHGAPVRASCAAGKICLEIGNDSEPVSLDPHKITANAEDRVVGDMFVGLTQSNAAGETIKGVADEYHASPDGLVWTFHLRNSNWSDGVPVTADDFVYGLRRVLDPKTASDYASLMYLLKNGQAVNEGRMPLTALGVRAVDPHTLEITLEHPAPYLPELTKHQTMYPVPKHVIEKWGDAWTRAEHFVSNGPYKLVEWRFGDRIRLTKNPQYWDAKSVCVDQADYYPAIDATAAERRVRRGELDISNNVLSNRVAFMRQPGQIPTYVHTHTYLATAYLFLNTRNVAAFRDVRVRQALGMAIDRDFMTSQLLRAGQSPAYKFVPPGVTNYVGPPNPDWASWPLARRQAAARALLAQAGYGPNHPLSVEIKSADLLDAQHLITSIQSDWQAIGVNTTLIQEESQILFQDYHQRDFQAGFASWIADYNDPMSFLYLMQSTTGQQNYGDYNSPRYDALLHAADQEPNGAKRALILQQAEALMLKDQAIAPIYFGINRNLVNPRITGWVDDISDLHRLQYLCVKGAGAAH